MYYASKILTLTALICFIGAATPTEAQVEIQLHRGEVRCFEPTIKLSHIATVTSGNARLKKAIESLDIDTFTKDQNSIEISKQQIQIRLAISGHARSDFTLNGPDNLIAVSVNPENLRSLVKDSIEEQLAAHFLVPQQDINVSLNPKFSDKSLAAYDFSEMRIDQNFPADIPLGRHSVSVMAKDASGRTATVKIPVSIAVIRDLVVAKQNISKGQMLGPDNIESVRRPVTSRRVRFASYDQVVGSLVQNDIQQYELIKSNLVRTASTQSPVAVKRNSFVSIISRRGALTVVLKQAKALQSGSVGDVITVTNPKTNERIPATVIDASTVEIRF